MLLLTFSIHTSKVDHSIDHENCGIRQGFCLERHAHSNLSSSGLHSANSLKCLARNCPLMGYIKPRWEFLDPFMNIIASNTNNSPMPFYFNYHTTQAHTPISSWLHWWHPCIATLWMKRHIRSLGEVWRQVIGILCGSTYLVELQQPIVLKTWKRSLIGNTWLSRWMIAV